MMQTDWRIKGRTRSSGSRSSDDLERDVVSLQTLDTDALRQRWKALFGSDPSPHFGRSVLVRAISYRIQEAALGGLKPATQRLLDRIAESRSETVLDRIPKRLNAGAVLIRQWGGVTHRVLVLVDGVVYRKRRYKSLSEVARAITGARWSGPLFFGLKHRDKEAAHG